MLDIPHEVHRRILHKLETAQRAVLESLNATKIPSDYQNFDHAILVLVSCRESIERVRDQEQIIGVLRMAADMLGLFDAGLAGPAVSSARLAIDEIVADLGS
jgi:hypothetical protein